MVISHGLAFLAGHGPMDSDRKPLVTGAVGLEVIGGGSQAGCWPRGVECRRSLRPPARTLDNVEQVVAAAGYVLSAPGFSASAAWRSRWTSEVLVQIFGPVAGRDARRTSIGVASSALSMSVTVDLVSPASR